MAIHVIPLTPARNLPRDGRIITPIRSDITDYGTPGHHLHPPLALGRLKIKTGGGAELTPPGEETTPSPFEQCLGVGGDVYSFGDLFAVGNTVLVSELIPFPYAITHIFTNTNGLIADDVRFRLKYSSDNSTTGGLDTTGTKLGLNPGGRGDIVCTNNVVEYYPYFIVPLLSSFLKVIAINNAAGSITMEIGISLRKIA